MRQPLKTTLRRLVNVTVIGLYLNSMTFTAWADAVTAGSAAGQSVGQQALQVFDGGDASVEYLKLETLPRSRTSTATM